MGLRAPVDDLAEALAVALGGARITELRRLTGGASRETWTFEADGRVLIVQRQTAAPDGVRIDIAAQAALLQTARANGVPVPTVVAATEDSMIVEHIDGETIPRKILRDDAFGAARATLTERCGEALASIHAMPVGVLPARDEVAVFRRALDDSTHAHPAFELAFRWLARARPARARTTVVHGDFRMGNLIVAADGLRAVIDWELAHVGDPMQDLGWLCVKSWRFGGALPVGGFGTREELFASYERASGMRVDPSAVHWWEVFGTMRWGIICIMQSMRHLSGAEQSVELAAIGRRVAEVEHDLLELLP